MPDSFSNALLAALNQSVELKERDWRSIEAVLRGPVQPADTRPTGSIATSEDRYAATVSSGMAKVRAGR